jgi:hypothetical protein
MLFIRGNADRALPVYHYPGSLRRWQPVTPAMAARLTDHVWTTTELLSYRVPPHFLDELPDLERLYPPFEETHHGS